MRFTSLKSITANKCIAKKILALGGIFFVLLLPRFAAAQLDINSSNADPLGTGYPAASGEVAADPRITVAKIIRVLLSLLGIIFLVIIVYAGFEWMTSAGNNEKIEQAKKRMVSGIIGLAIILASYAITAFVLINLTNAVQSGAARSIF